MEEEQTPTEVKPSLNTPKTEFETAIENTTIDVLETSIDPQTETQLKEQIDKSGVLILGEMHGVQENPQIIYTLAQKFGIKNFALEWDKELKTMVDEYLTTGNLDYDKIAKSPDGRITAGHFVMLKKLHDEGKLGRLICFDEEFRNWKDWGERDETMAKNILSHLNGEPTIVIAGNLHTQTAPVAVEGRRQQPMGEHLKKVLPGAPIVSIDYLSGQYYNIGLEEFADQRKPDSKTALREDTDSKYTLELPEANPATVPNTELQKHSAAFSEALEKAKKSLESKQDSHV